ERGRVDRPERTDVRLEVAVYAVLGGDAVGRRVEHQEQVEGPHPGEVQRNPCDGGVGDVDATGLHAQHQSGRAAAVVGGEDELDVVVLVESEEESSGLAGLDDLPAERVGDANRDRHRLARVKTDLQRVVLRVGAGLVGTGGGVDRHEATGAT